MSLWRKVPMVLFVYLPISLVMWTLYVVGAAWAFIWTCLEIGYGMGNRGFERFVDSFDKYK